MINERDILLAILAAIILGVLVAGVMYGGSY